MEWSFNRQEFHPHCSPFLEKFVDLLSFVVASLISPVVSQGLLTKSML